MQERKQKGMGRRSDDDDGDDDDEEECGSSTLLIKKKPLNYDSLFTMIAPRFQ